MKKYIAALLLAVTFITSCFKDKGNYDYKELADIKVERVPERINVLGKIERIVVNPKIISSKEGEIKGDNPNYSFRYRLGYKSYGALGGIINSEAQAWVDLQATNGFNLDIPADFEANNYVCWFTITDKRNNTVHSHVFDVIVTSTTYQGWMVLSNMGPEERVRVDMISHISDTRTEVLYDIAKGLPEIHRGTQIAIHPSMSVEYIAVFSKQGSYFLNNNTLDSDPQSDYTKTSFFTPPPEPVTSTKNMCIKNNWPFTVGASFGFTDAGNAYCRQYGMSGSLHGLAINTTKAGTAPQFKVAPFAGVSEVRPGNSGHALFYDRDNKRFMGFFIANRGVVTNQQMTVIPDPSPKLFSYQTGEDMVYMEGTRRSNGLVYAILQDDQGKRSIYGINLGGSSYQQESYYENVSAPGFEQATLFAFHSKFPLMFYAVGNKVYQYNLATRIATEMTNITGGEITCLKFNLFQNALESNLNIQTEEFLNQQYQLIVGTYDHSVANGNGGKVALYEVDGSSNTVNKLHEYGGFGKVKDVTYRERNK